MVTKETTETNTRTKLAWPRGREREEVEERPEECMTLMAIMTKATTFRWLK